MSRSFESSLQLIFVCMAVRALHLEVSSSIETEKSLTLFINSYLAGALRCSYTLINGGTFRRAKSILQLNWDFEPPHGSHHQGLVKTTRCKGHQSSLLKVTEGSVPTFEELSTLFAQV